MEVVNGGMGRHLAPKKQPSNWQLFGGFILFCFVGHICNIPRKPMKCYLTRLDAGGASTLTGATFWSSKRKASQNIWSQLRTLTERLHWQVCWQTWKTWVKQLGIQFSHSCSKQGDRICSAGGFYIKLMNSESPFLEYLILGTPRSKWK